MKIENKHPNTVSEKKVGSKVFAKNEKHISVILVVIIVILIIVSLLLLSNAITVGAASAKRSYLDEKNRKAEEVREGFYTAAREHYAVKNDVTINVEEIRKIEELEVLKVSDVEYIIDEEESRKGTTMWLEVPGTGTFTVDLKTSEIIVDDERGYVHVRLCVPELKNCDIDYSNVQLLNVKESIGNGSDKIGEEEAMKKLGEAQLMIRESIESDQQFLESAKNSARALVTSSIKAILADRDDIVVEVEFFDDKKR